MFHLSTEMQIQLLCFAALVIVCVAGTRLIYHDGIVGDIRRLKWHCQMQAALILILCGWAGSIGFRINESCVAIIEEQSEVIEQLQAMRGEPVKGIANRSSIESNHVVLTTSKGNVVEGDLYGMRIRARRSSGSGGRGSRFESGQRSGTAVHAVSGDGCTGVNIWSLVSGSIMPDESRECCKSSNAIDFIKKNDESRYFPNWPRAVFEINQGRTETVLRMAKRAPIKTPELSELR